MVKSLEKLLPYDIKYDEILDKLNMLPEKDFDNDTLAYEDNYQRILALVNNHLQHYTYEIQNAKDSSKYKNGFEYEMQKNQVESCEKQLEVTYNLINEQEKQIYSSFPQILHPSTQFSEKPFPVPS